MRGKYLLFAATFVIWGASVLSVFSASVLVHYSCVGDGHVPRACSDWPGFFAMIGCVAFAIFTAKMLKTFATKLGIKLD